MATLSSLTVNDTGFLQAPVGTTAERPTPAVGQLRRNSVTGVIEVYNGTAWIVNSVKRNVDLGSTSTNPARSALHILAANPTAASGLYWIQPSGFATAQQLYCDMDFHGGGWMMVASNHSADTTIPSGTSRQNQLYELDRPGQSGPLLSSAVGAVISPNFDYIIGPMINNLNFDQARIFLFGGTGTSQATAAGGAGSIRADLYSWPTAGSTGNLGMCGVWIWDIRQDVTGSARLTAVTRREQSVRAYGSTQSSSNYFILDSVKADRLNGGYTSNSNQITVGAAATAGSSGDPTTGTYIGHGATEGAYEGWYHIDGNAYDCVGYTTWVR